MSESIKNTEDEVFQTKGVLIAKKSVKYKRETEEKKAF